jgi:hypothetical protein
MDREKFIEEKKRKVHVLEDHVENVRSQSEFHSLSSPFSLRPTTLLTISPIFSCVFVCVCAGVSVGCDEELPWNVSWFPGSRSCGFFPFQLRYPGH